MIRIFMLLSALVALTACGNHGTHSATSDSNKSEIAKTIVEPDLFDTHTGTLTYTGTLPAADCPGIALTLNLYNDGSYTSRSEYLERNTTYNEQGRFTIEDDRLTLYPDEGEPADCFRIEGDNLRLLDCDKQPITGKLADHYVLTRKNNK